MPHGPRRQLRDFYDQALLVPELLCMHCSRTAWNSPAGRCSASRRQDCELFVSHMIKELAQRPAPRPRRRQPAVSTSP